MKVILMSGIPGSGKTSYVTRMVRENEDCRFLICSADHYFQTDSSGKYDPEANYKFDFTKLSSAHNACIRKFAESIVPSEKEKYNFIVVDNTNSTTLELAPYVAIANAYGIPAELHTIKCNAHLAAERNLHGVGYTTCSAMSSNIENREIPFYWNLKSVIIDGEDY